MVKWTYHGFFVGAMLLLPILCAGAAVKAPSPAPIALAGFNADIVTDKNSTLRFAEPNDVGTAAWFEAGAVDDSDASISKRTHADGLPSGSFKSAFTNSVTGGHTAFKFQPFNDDNVLLLRADDANIGSLTLTKPAAYNNLAILASAYNAAPKERGSVVLNFSDGSHSRLLNYNAYDWGYGIDHVALGGLGRNYDIGEDGKQFNYNKPVPFAVYETDFDLVALGYSTKTLQSLTFAGGTEPDQSGLGPSTSIFAVSGSAADPEAVLAKAPAVQSPHGRT